jgi:ribosomal protein S10
MVYPNNLKMPFIRIRFYLFSKKSLHQLKRFLYFWSNSIQLPIVKISVQHKKTLFSLTKSPHVFKKSQQQYYSSFYILSILIDMKNFVIVNKMLLYVITRVDVLFLKLKFFSKL